MNETEGPVQPSTQEILAEVERRRTAPPAVTSERTARIVMWLDRRIFWLTQHWAAVLNLLALLYIGLPFLAPVLMASGAQPAGRILYLLYHPMCHQLPQRSWFLFGPQAAYSSAELAELVGSDASPSIYSASFVGNADVGYKVALCQRDVAIYGAIVAAGLLYATLRRWVKIRPLHWAPYVAFGVLPMLIDGGYQWLSYMIALIWPSNPFIRPHETTPLLRTITGTLFGLATVWLAYPHVEATAQEFRHDLQQRFGWGQDDEPGIPAATA